MAALQNVLTLTFVVSSMFGVGLALTFKQIAEPMRNLRVVATMLVGNFVIAPAAAFLLSKLIRDPQFATGILLLGAAAGAPFALKLAELAEGDMPLAVGLLVLSLVGTVLFMPIALPLVVSGVQIDPLPMARHLIMQMLLPLALGLLVHSRYEAGAAELLPDVQKIANIALALLLVFMVLTNFDKMLGMLGTGAVVATVLLVVVAAGAGWLLGGPHRAQHVSYSIVMGQRNFAACFVVANSTFAAQPNVNVYVAGASIITLSMLFLFAGELRRRAPKRWVTV